MPSYPEPLVLVLTLQPDNPCNTSIVDSETGDVLYTVFTLHEKKKTVTYVKAAEGKTIASWEWHDVRSDTLMLGSGSTARPIPAGTWLQRSIIPFNSTVTFKDEKHRIFKWKNVEAGGQMELFSADDKKAPIASFRKSLRFTDRRRDPPTMVVRDATLELNSRGQRMVNLVVVSFLLLEKGRRVSETSQETMAGALAIAMR